MTSRTYLGVGWSSRKSSYSRTSRRLGSSSTRSRDAQEVRHVNLSHVYGRAWKAAHGLYSRGQSLDEARSRNRPCSGNLRLLVTSSESHRVSNLRKGAHRSRQREFSEQSHRVSL